ncbi:chemotaxis protein CheW [Azospirillum halopraeferens]|uniref:chemotaxis protein CheW n=1 Tax=Azospirillum halopraeferens TaxID=34010 RepID=UPI0004068C84|nr:chemotaxis protein CheW [Azospirillum halopraeferens]
MTGGPGSAAEAPTGDTGRYLAFRVAGARLAVPLAAAQEILRPPEVVRLPLAPAGLEGLARRHGRVLPVVSLRRVFGLPPGESGDGARLVVVDHRGQAVGLAVDSVDGVDTVEMATMDPGGADEAARDAGIDAALVAGALRGAGGGVSALILDTMPLIDRQFVAPDGRAVLRTPEAGAAAPDRTTVASGTTRNEAVLVGFAVGGQEFALPVAEVERIVPLAETVARMPGARAHLLGVVAVGDDLLPLIGLRALFGLDGEPPSAAPPRVVIAAPAQDRRVGLVVDAVREILRPEPAAVGPVPAILAREPEFADLDGIIRLEGGRRLVSLLSARRMVQHAAALADVDDGSNREEGAGMAQAGPERGEAHVVFRLGSGEYGLPVAAVREVLPHPDALAPLPRAPAFVSGLANLRGSALPVLDPAVILKLPEGAGARTRILVAGLHGTLIGLAVDGVAGVVRIPDDAIEPAPAVSEAQRHLIRGIGSPGHGKRMILLLRIDALLDMDQLSTVVETI